MAESELQAAADDALEAIQRDCGLTKAEAASVLLELVNDYLEGNLDDNEG
jgi:hypothetical protein